MTVTELLNRIMAAYPGATNEAMQTFVPVFHARLRKHEGEKLETAATTVFAAFKPKYDHRFPLPADFETHLPSGRLDLSKIAGPSIRETLANRPNLAREAFSIWERTQGAKIRDNRSRAVYLACRYMASELTANGKRVTLTADQIRECDGRALSQDRVRMFGPVPKTEEAWLSQIEQVKSAWMQPEGAR